MIVEVKQNKTEKDFPKLMISQRGVIVLFETHKTGVCLVDPNRDYKIGVYSPLWSVENFQDFDGEITLKND